MAQVCVCVCVYTGVDNSQLEYFSLTAAVECKGVCHPILWILPSTNSTQCEYLKLVMTLSIKLYCISILFLAEPFYRTQIKQMT